MKKKKFRTTAQQLGALRGYRKGVSFENPEAKRLKQLLKKRKKMRGHWEGSHYVID